MPELPDVENFRQYFDNVALHKAIESVDVENNYVLKNTSAKSLNQELEGKAFDETCRHGKNLFASLDKGGCLRFHFGMTGSVQAYAEPSDQPKYTRVRFNFRDGDHLAYADLRMLGEIELVQGPQDYARKHGLGPDAAGISLPDFQHAFEGKRGMIKSVLMDQAVIAGIGNVYADEILYQARFHPQQQVDELSQGDLKKLHSVMRKVLSTAVERHADPSKLPSSYLIPRRRKGQSCPRCKSKLGSIKVGGRTTWFCPSCQK